MRLILQLCVVLLLLVGVENHAWGKMDVGEKAPYGDFFAESESEPGAEWLWDADGTRDAAPGGYDFALDVHDGPNLYAYVRQNPWTAFDPEGLSEFQYHHAISDRKDTLSYSLAEDLGLRRDDPKWGKLVPKRFHGQSGQKSRSGIHTTGPKSNQLTWEKALDGELEKILLKKKQNFTEADFAKAVSNTWKSDRFKSITAQSFDPEMGYLKWDAMDEAQKNAHTQNLKKAALGRLSSQSNEIASSKSLSKAARMRGMLMVATSAIMLAHATNESEDYANRLHSSLDEVANQLKSSDVTRSESAMADVANIVNEVATWDSSALKAWDNLNTAINSN